MKSLSLKADSDDSNNDLHVQKGISSWMFVVVVMTMISITKPPWLSIFDKSSLLEKFSHFFALQIFI